LLFYIVRNKVAVVAVNTQFSIAVHLMAALGYHFDQEVISAELAGSVNTSASFVRRTLAKLSKAGLIVTATGKNGACRLACRPRDVSLLEIYRAVDAPKVFAIHDYAVQRQCPVSCRIKDALGKALGKTQTAFEKGLAQTSLADIVAELKA
jgi:Rrf2 family protein